MGWLDELHRGADEVAARLGDLSEALDRRADLQAEIVQAAIEAVRPALPYVCDPLEDEYLDDDGEYLALAGPGMVEAEVIEGARSTSQAGWRLLLGKDGRLTWQNWGWCGGAMDYISPREALSAGLTTAPEVIRTLAAVLDRHLHGGAVRRHRMVRAEVERLERALDALRSAQEAHHAS